MNQLSPARLVLVAVSFSALFLCAGRASATEISGTISTTLTIFDDSELTGDVTCAVPLTATGPNGCIAFGASGIKLRLNGFTITGSSTDCKSSTATQDGIDAFGTQTAAINDVAVLGPGRVQRFKRFGIAVRFASKAKVEGVTATDNCFSGIFLFATSDSDIERNVSVRNSISSGGNPCGGT